jgi:1,2-diacylglycerol 3-beta-glucosyltransferase
MRATVRTGALAATAAAQAWAAAGTGYLLGLLAAASAPAPAAPAVAGRSLRFVTLVPAHDEAGGIADTVRALAAQELPGETIVLADNCGDDTARIAAAAGATVWERDAPDARGKGQALAWALERLWRERPETEAVAIVDADCLASPNLLSACDRRLRAGARAVQAAYVVSNADASTASALRHAGFALMHVVRPRGKERLGVSIGLFGTGMAFAADVLREHPWSSFSVTEDAEYHLRLVEAGVRVRYAGEAHVASPMPTSDAAAREQQLRWESGNAALARRGAPRLLAAGLRRRDRQRLHAAVERLVPPQSLLLAAACAAGAAALALRSRRLVAAGALTAAGQAGYVLGGLAVAGAPPAVYRALAHAPALAAHKLGVFARVGTGRGARAWVRTQRDVKPKPEIAHEVAALTQFQV